MNIQTSGFAQADTPDLGLDPIPAKAYYDPEYYELERKAVFMRTWIQCAHVCELPQPGSFIRREFEFARASLLIMRGKDGEIRAFHNVCTHRGTALTDEPCGKRSTFSCRYHMWTFGTDGKLLSAPDFERFGIDKADAALTPVACEVVAGLIFVNFDKQPKQSLREFLGPLAERMEYLPCAKATTFSEYVYDIDANWKLTYDNFQESYHLRFIHTKSGAATFDEINPFGYPAKQELHDPHRTQTIWSNPNSASKMTPSQLVSFGLAAKAAARGDVPENPYARDYFALFPNFFMLGTNTQNFSHTVMPLGPEKSRGVIRLYWVGDDQTAGTRYAREYAMATARDIHAEDISVIEAGQRGLSSGALKHIHFQQQEVLCRHLYLMVDKAIEEYKAAHQP
jgi:phenylpropionate dioxygenase-like ring-hydroxylating dioxygenase large terminal subunit